jgi:hypothetical protein
VHLKEKNVQRRKERNMRKKVDINENEKRVKDKKFWEKLIAYFPLT